jgi:group I intron endonuclease
MYVYIITNLINGKQYVGKSSKRIEETKRYFGSGKYIKLAIEKYGKENFRKDVLIESIDTIDDLNRLEIWAIEFNKTQIPNGYNITEGGDGHGPLSEEQKEKLRGKGNPMYGKKHSEESKKKMSKSSKKYNGMTGKKHSEEAKRKIGEAHKGREVSEETREKLSKSLTGRKGTFKGRKHSKEAREKMRQKKLGTKLSEEHKKNISNGLTKKAMEEIMNQEPFNADFITQNNWDPIIKCIGKVVKKTFYATQMNFPEGFQLTTPPGVMKGKPGDYLVIDEVGNKFICAKDVFERAYDIIED